MTDPSGGAAEKSTTTAKDRIIGGVLGAVLLGLGVWMLLNPDLGIVPDDAEAGGKGSRKVLGILRLLEWVWSRPGGVIIGLIGGLALYGSINPVKDDEPARDEAPPS